MKLKSVILTTIVLLSMLCLSCKKEAKIESMAGDYVGTIYDMSDYYLPVSYTIGLQIYSDKTYRMNVLTQNSGFIAKGKINFTDSIENKYINMVERGSANNTYRSYPVEKGYEYSLQVESIGLKKEWVGGLLNPEIEPEQKVEGSDAVRMIKKLGLPDKYMFIDNSSDGKGIKISLNGNDTILEPEGNK